MLKISQEHLQISVDNLNMPTKDSIEPLFEYPANACCLILEVWKSNLNLQHDEQARHHYTASMEHKAAAKLPRDFK